MRTTSFSLPGGTKEPSSALWNPRDFRCRRNRFLSVASVKRVATAHSYHRQVTWLPPAIESIRKASGNYSKTLQKLFKKSPKTLCLVQPLTTIYASSSPCFRRASKPAVRQGFHRSQTINKNYLFCLQPLIPYFLRDPFRRNVSWSRNGQNSAATMVISHASRPRSNQQHRG